MANYIYAFDSGVYDTTKMGNPAPINVDVNAEGWGGTFPLSATNNSFALISAGKINHNDVEGVLFNYIAAASGHHSHVNNTEDFYLQSPGGPDHSNLAAVANISLSANPSFGSAMRLQTGSSAASPISTFYAVASGTEASNTGMRVGTNPVPGSIFYSNTGTHGQVLLDLQSKFNHHGAAGGFNANYIEHSGQLQITQRSLGPAGNTNIAVSGVDVITVDNSFTGGADEQLDATRIRVAGGPNTTAGYDGHTVAVVTTTGRTVTYLLTHGSATATRSAAPVLSGYNLATGPNMRRQVNMGMR